MSHPRICPCPNCIGTGASTITTIMGAVALAGAVAVAYELSRFSAWAGRAPFIVAAVLISTAVIGGIVRAITSSVRPPGSTGYQTEPVRVTTPELPVSQPVTEPITPSEYPPLRLVRRDEVA